MSYKSEESKVYQGLNPLWKKFSAFRSEHNVGDIYIYMKNINYFFDKDDKPIDRMESLMYLIASLTSDEYGYHCVAVPVNGKKKVFSVLINGKYDMRDDEYYNSERLCPDERYEFCFSDKSPNCKYRYVSKYIMRHGAKHYVIDCSLSIFNKKESIIKFCNALIGLFNDGEFMYVGLGKLELPDFDPTEPFHIEDSEPLESDRTKYDRYLIDGEWRKAEKVETGGRTVKFDVEDEKEKLRILNKKLELYKEVAFSIIMFLTMLSGVFFLVFAVIKLLL